MHTQFGTRSCKCSWVWLRDSRRGGVNVLVQCFRMQFRCPAAAVLSLPSSQLAAPSIQRTHGATKPRTNPLLDTKHHPANESCETRGNPASNGLHTATCCRCRLWMGAQCEAPVQACRLWTKECDSPILPTIKSVTVRCCLYVNESPPMGWQAAAHKDT